ncbi:MAG: nitrogen regulation protein NR(II) [Phycisphaerae bacterium]
MTQSERDAYYRQLCENLGVAVVATDADFNICIWNDGAARMFGASADSMRGTPIESIFPRAPRDEAMALLARALGTGEVIPFEFQHRDEHGGCRELIATFAPVISDSGARIGVSASLRDITHRIAMQHELAENRKMAALGTLAGLVAHHFNNVFGGIITSADFAVSTDDRSVMRRVLTQSAEALMRSSALVNGLLAFSGGQQHADDLSDFTEIVVSLVDELEMEVGPLGIELQSQVPELPVMPVPRSQTMTVLRNIAKNAIEAMPDGGTLQIRVHLGADQIVTEITDSGRGLDEVSQSRMFEPFWTTKRDPGAVPGKAVGLGLAIAHGLVQVLGGSIRVTSQPDIGSTFRVSIPRPDHR